MKGAHEYFSPLLIAAREEKEGFHYSHYNKDFGGGYIYNDRLLFHIGEHARGKTLDIWLFRKGLTPNPATACEPSAVKVYGKVDGQFGWNESYGFLDGCHGKIMTYVMRKLKAATDYYAWYKHEQHDQKVRATYAAMEAHKALLEEFEESLDI